MLNVVKTLEIKPEMFVISNVIKDFTLSTFGLTNENLSNKHIEAKVKALIIRLRWFILGYKGEY